LKEEATNPKYWWNYMRTVSEEEIDLLPHTYIKKYNSLMKNFIEYQKHEKMRDN